MAQLTGNFIRASFMRLAAAAAVAASVPGYAQTAVEAKAVEATLGSWVEAFNRGDSTVQFFTKDATLVRGNGVFVGGARIDEMEQRESQAGLRLALTVDRVEQIGAEYVWTLGRYILAIPGNGGAAPQTIPGMAVHVLHRDGSTWRVKVSSFTRLQTPLAPQATVQEPVRLGHAGFN